MLGRQDFITLLEKYIRNTISPGERDELMEAIATGDYDELLLQHIEGNLESRGLPETALGPDRSSYILNKILSSEKQNSELIASSSSTFSVMRWMIAATVIIVIIFSLRILNEHKNKGQFPDESFAGRQEKFNSSAAPLKITLEDSSTITLEPGATIRYPAHFLSNKREVVLEGEAFFEVSKNAARPFFVFNKNIITHVLGTSFRVGLNKKTGQVEVSVRSGRVEVYENKPLVKSQGDRKNNGVILMPNQKAVYEQDSRQFIPSLVDVPLPVPVEPGEKNLPAENFSFSNTSLKTVLGLLEETFGIEIIVENNNIYHCLFSGDVSRQDLYSRLDILCQSVGAFYETKGTRILIKGPGCAN